ILECVEEAIALVTPQAAAKSLELIYTLAPDTPSVLIGDITRLRQICINLLGNAVKFTERGTVSLALSARDLPESVRERGKKESSADSPIDRPCEIVCEVRDTGIGIAPDRAEQLFEPFAQADASTTRNYGGTGLGLTICKRLCELMGGGIQVESQLGQGSTFRFTVLARVSPDAAPIALPHLAANERVALWYPHEAGASLERLLQAWGANVTRLSPADVDPDSQDGRSKLSEFESDDSSTLNLACFDLAIVAADPARSSDDRPSPGLMFARRCARHNVPFVAIGRGHHQIAAQLAEVAAPLAVLSPPVKQSQLQALLAQHFLFAEREAAPVADPVAAASPLAEAMPLRILLAEDVAVNQTVLLALLKCLGYTADVVADGRTALDAIATLRYDLVLIDIHMPYLDGLDVVRQWRQREDATPTRPWIVVTTARTLPGDRETCLAAGANDYLSKPIRLEALEATLLRFQHQADPDTANSTASLPASDRAFDPAALNLIRDSLGNDADATLAEIVDLYLDRSTAYLETIAGAIAANDATRLQEASHSLKSASATVGAIAIATHCERLEQLGRTNAIEDAAKILPQLQLDYPIAVATLASIRPSTPNSANASGVGMG
ncbi:MAG: ATP-binding protein, partial [Cyanobacteria bacterium J06639_1]